MNILSIDIGIKNLACCIFHVDSSISIVKWDVLNLVNNPTCVILDKGCTRRMGSHLAVLRLIKAWGS